MDRRAFLAAAVGGLAGCGSSGDGEPGSDTPRPTETATPTPVTSVPSPTLTPPEQRYRPQLLDVALVSGWSAFGDITKQRIDTLRRGRPAVVAFRYRARIPQGTINVSEGVDVSRGEEAVARRVRHVDRDVDEAGLHTWEDAMTFETGDWPMGTLEATVAIGELQLHRVSDPMVTRFELTGE
jgi:hypothetical protein